MVALNRELDIIEIMARQGMTEHQWEQQTFAYIKMQRETAGLMHRALLLAHKLVVDQDEWLALKEGSERSMSDPPRDGGSQ